MRASCVSLTAFLPTHCQYINIWNITRWFLRQRQAHICTDWMITGVSMLNIHNNTSKHSWHGRYASACLREKCKPWGMCPSLWWLRRTGCPEMHIRDEWKQNLTLSRDLFGRHRKCLQSLKVMCVSLFVCKRPFWHISKWWFSIFYFKVPLSYLILEVRVRSARELHKVDQPAGPVLHT